MTKLDIAVPILTIVGVIIGGWVSLAFDRGFWFPVLVGIIILVVYFGLRMIGMREKWALFSALSGAGGLTQVEMEGALSAWYFNSFGYALADMDFVDMLRNPALINIRHAREVIRDKGVEPWVMLEVPTNLKYADIVNGRGIRKLPYKKYADKMKAERAKSALDKLVEEGNLKIAGQLIEDLDSKMREREQLERMQEMMKRANTPLPPPPEPPEDVPRQISRQELERRE